MPRGDGIPIGLASMAANPSTVGRARSITGMAWETAPGGGALSGIVRGPPLPPNRARSRARPACTAPEPAQGGATLEMPAVLEGEPTPVVTGAEGKG